MKTRLAVALITCIAIAAFAQTLASDFGSKKTINHSHGVITFPYDKLQQTKNVCGDAGDGVCVNKYAKTLTHYTTVAAYPTLFIPETVVWDGGAGCAKHTLTEYPLVTGRVADAGRPIYCQFTTPYEALDAGVYTIFREIDGGFGLSQCAKVASVPSTPWPAFCTVQGGVKP